MLDGFLDFLGALLVGHGAESLHQLALVGHVHELRHKWQRGRTVLLGQRLDRFRQGLQLLCAETAGAGHILEGHLEARAAYIVGQVGISSRVALELVEHHGAVSAHGITLNHHGALTVANIADEQAEQHFPHQLSAGAKVVHDGFLQLVGLLHLGLLLQAARGIALAPHKAAGGRPHTLHGGARHIQHTQLLLIELVVAVHIKLAVVRQGALFESDNAVHPADLLANLCISHIRDTIGQGHAH